MTSKALDFNVNIGIIEGSNSIEKVKKVLMSERILEYN